MRTLDLRPGDSPREWGRAHGETFREEIKLLAVLRTHLCTTTGTFTRREQVMAAARAHLAPLERYHAGLHAELVGIAEGSATTPEEIVIANHYTDLRDLDPDPTTWQPSPTRDEPEAPTGARAAEPTGDGCSALWAESPTGRILAQTWDCTRPPSPS
jgi:isopenicillin-N N-acyltransferase like protein